MSNTVYVETIVEPVTGSLAVHGAASDLGKITAIYAVDEQGSTRGPYTAPVKVWSDRNNRLFYAAWFPTLPPGQYVTSKPGMNGQEQKSVAVLPNTQANANY